MSDYLQPQELQHSRLLVLHYLPESVQTHVHCVTKPTHPLSPLHLLPSIYPSIRVFSNELALGIRSPMYCSFSTSPSNEYSGLIPLGLTGLNYLLSKEPSRVFSSTIIQKHHFFSVQSSLWSNSHIHTQLLEKP